MNKDIIIGILFLAIIGLGYTVYSTNQKIERIQSNYKQLESNVVEATTKTVEKIILSDIVPSIRKALKGTVTGKGNVSSKQKHTVQTRQSTNSKAADKYGAKEKELYWKNDDGQKLPIGVAIYRPNKDSWLARTYEMRFNTNIVISEEYDGTYHTYVETYASVPHRKGYENTKYKLKIDDAQFEFVKPRTLTFSFWNPTLSLGLISTNRTTLQPALKFNFINYGYKKQLPVWSFASPVVGYDSKNKSTTLGIEIIGFNVGHVLPVIKDLHFGVGITTKKSGFLSLTTTF